MYRRIGKRLLDLGLVVPAILLISPLFLVLALPIRIELGSPVLFRQKRPGLHGRGFTIYKFRTMRDLRNRQDQPLPDEVRLTPLGRLLRRLSVDEIPELFNVLKGDMSLVGPRPLLVQYLDRYTPEQMRRHDVVPGITGWAQVNGRNEQSWDERFALDLWYVDHMSFTLDLKILAITVWKVLKGEGISAPGHSTMPDFQGRDD